MCTFVNSRKRVCGTRACPSRASTLLRNPLWGLETKRTIGERNERDNEKRGGVDSSTYSNCNNRNGWKLLNLHLRWYMELRSSIDPVRNQLGLDYPSPT